MVYTLQVYDAEMYMNMITVRLFDVSVTLLLRQVTDSCRTYRHGGIK